MATRPNTGLVSARRVNGEYNKPEKDRWYQSIANTLNAGVSFMAFKEVSGDHTADITDSLMVVEGTAIITLPTAAQIKGRRYDIKNMVDSETTIKPFEGETIDGESSITIKQPYVNITVIAYSGNWIII